MGQAKRRFKAKQLKFWTVEMTKKKVVSQKKEIIWNIINSSLAGALVFLGACSAGSITWGSVGVSLIAAAVVAVAQFKNYWAKEESEYSIKMFGRFL